MCPRGKWDDVVKKNRETKTSRETTFLDDDVCDSELHKTHFFLRKIGD